METTTFHRDNGMKYDKQRQNGIMLNTKVSIYLNRLAISFNTERDVISQ